jgi:hypothetical protein
VTRQAIGDVVSLRWDDEVTIAICVALAGTVQFSAVVKALQRSSMQA